MEMLDVVNDDDVVVRTVSFNEVYKDLLTHRLVHVLVFNNKGEMLLQLRCKKKSFCPLHWTSAASGHVQSGEEYENAAAREFKEELGVSGKLDFFSKEFYVDKIYQIGLKKFIEIYKVKHEGPFKINCDEVERVEFCSLKKIRRMIDEGEKFHPEFLMILKNYFRINC